MFFYLFFNWKFSLQCCIGFCHTMQTSRNYTYITSPSSPSPTPRGLHRVSGWLPVLYSNFSPAVSLTVVYACQGYFPPFVSLFPSLHCVHKSVLYICFSSDSLQRGSSMPFFRFHIYALTHYVCFSLPEFTLHNCITHLPRTDTNSLFFLWLIFHCICVPSNLTTGHIP